MEKKYLFLLMGDAPKGSGVSVQIKKLINTKAPNVSVIATGYLYPVPTKLLELCDAFFTSAGSSWVCMRSGVPTITIDGNDFKPIGILDRTTEHTIFRGEEEPVQELAELMEEILTEKKYKKEIPCYREGLPDFLSHINALADSSKEKDYYDVESIKASSALDFKLRLALTVVGPQLYLKLGALKQRWKNMSQKTK